MGKACSNEGQLPSCHRPATITALVSVEVLNLNQLAELLTSVSRNKFLPWFAPVEQLDAIQVCRRFKMFISPR